MHTPRLLTLVAAVGLFVCGIFVGMFVGGDKAGASGMASSGLEKSEAYSTPSRSRSAAPAGVYEEGAQGFEDGSGSLVPKLWSVLTMGDENERYAEWLRLLPGLTAANAGEIRALFEKRKAEGFNHPVEWDAFWSRWGEVDGAGAMAYLKSKEPMSSGMEMVKKVMRGWARTDPEAARTWFLANPGASYEPLHGYIDGISRVDLSKATSEAIALGKDKNLAPIASMLVERAVQQRKIDGLVDWWNTLPDDPSDKSLRRVAVAAIHSRLEANPLIAREWTAQLAGTPYRDDHHVGRTAGLYAEQDPQKALEWAASLPPSPKNGHYDGITRTVQALQRKDPAALDRWLQTVPPSPLRDQALEAKEPQVVIHPPGATIEFEALVIQGSNIQQPIFSTRNVSP